MNNIYYKAVRYDYGSFRDPDFKYGPIGTVVKHPYPALGSWDPVYHLSVSTDPADCIDFRWRVDGKDSRLLIVEPIGKVWTPRSLTFPNKRAVTALKVVDELPIAHAFGPNGAAVVAYLETVSTVTHNQWDMVYVAAREAAREAAVDAAEALVINGSRVAARFTARNVVMYATRDLARGAARSAAVDAAEALVVRDMIMPKQFDILVEPMRAAGVEFPMHAVGGGGK